MNPSKKSFNVTTLLCLILIIAPLFSGCSGSEGKENKSLVSVSPAPVKAGTANEKYYVNKEESLVTWKCGGHVGYVYASKGELLVEKDLLVGGMIDVDMTTIEDKDHGSKNNLIDHLKSADFFEVEKFPIALFGITKIGLENGEKMVTGVMTIKGVMQTITFPAKIEVKNGVVNATGKVTIDRTLWDIRYKSGKFYDLLADETISDSIELEMKIVAKRGS